MARRSGTAMPGHAAPPAAAIGFPPVAGPAARVLVLGSLPGAMSLARREYYAQPRNAFWPIMGALLGAGPDLDYAARLARLAAGGVALWDVCASAVRPGSLDAAIDRASVTPNDLAGFLAAHPGIATICFNGATASALYARLARPFPPAAPRRIVLPSTSPAHAAMPFADKLRRWREALRDAGALVGPSPPD